jgi:prevent-host-death family protein
MAVIVNIHQAKTELSKLLERALAGEEVIIAKAGKPIVKLTPIQPRKKRRLAGLAAGKVWIAPDFDAPMPDDWLDAFYNGPIFPEDPLPSKPDSSDK